MYHNAAIPGSYNGVISTCLPSTLKKKKKKKAEISFFIKEKKDIEVVTDTRRRLVERVSG